MGKEYPRFRATHKYGVTDIETVVNASDGRAAKAAGIAFAQAMLQARREGKENFTLGPVTKYGTEAPRLVEKRTTEPRILSNAAGWTR